MSCAVNEKFEMEIKMKTDLEFKYNIYYCCDDVFKKLYGKYIRSLKHQFGKKKFQKASIVAYEYKNGFAYCEPKTNGMLVKNCCRKCYNMLKSKTNKKNPPIETIKRMEIIIRIPNE